MTQQLEKLYEDSLNLKWRMNPAECAVRWSDGYWVNQQHLDHIAQALEPMHDGTPLRLIVSMPPRHGKSEELSHWTPVWFLANNPTKNVGLASYSADFASDWGRATRDTIQELGPELGLHIRQDVNAASDWKLTTGGGMMTAGVGGPFTGRGFDLLIIDDPIKNRQEANSAVIRDNLWDWWRSTARTRLEPGASIIIVMTRWHEDDLVGRLLAGSDEDFADQWQHIRLPALAEPGDAIGRPEGQPLWPARYDEFALAQLRVAAGPSDWAGLYQQRPTQEGGQLFKLDWWQQVDELPPCTGQTIQFWDTAFKTGQENDYSVCMTVYVTAQGYVLKHMYRGRLEFPDLEAKAIEMDGLHHPQVIYIEDAASGQSLIQRLKKETRLPILPSKVDRDKVSRANAVTGLVAAGRVFVPEHATWLPDFLDEMSSFPNGAHDDIVDATVGALLRIAGVQMGAVIHETRTSPWTEGRQGSNGGRTQEPEEPGLISSERRGSRWG